MEAAARSQRSSLLGRSRLLAIFAQSSHIY